MADKVWRRFQSGLKANTRWTYECSYGRHMADTWRAKRKADTSQTRFGGAARVDTRPDIRQTCSGHMADKVWRRGHRGLKADTGQTQGKQSGLKADTWLTQVGHMVDTWRTRFGGAVKADSRRARDGYMADTRWTSSGDAARAYRSQPFFLRENPTVNCLGKKEKKSCTLHISNMQASRFCILRGRSSKMSLCLPLPLQLAC